VPPPEPTVKEREEAAYRQGFCEGRDEGFCEGEKKGYEEGRAVADPVSERLQCVVCEIENLRARKYREMEQDIVDLAVKIARQVVLREVSLPNDTIRGALRQALSMLESPERIVVKLNPADLELLQQGVANKAGVISGVEHAVFEADDTITRGGCYIETDLGDVDARIESRLQVVEDTFKSEFEKAAPPGSGP
jgi:flagellar assembly protein FliH